MKKWFVCLFVCLSTGFANAGLIEISNSDSGWYSSEGNHNSSNQNYIVGNCCRSGPFHNFFTFDLGGISDTVTSATLQLFTSDVTASGTFSLFDVSTSIASLTAGGLGLVSTYDDLGSGSNFGSIDILSTQDSSFIQIVLNSNAISSINSAGGFFAIGGSYSLNGSGQFAFGRSEFNLENKLILNTEAVSVPEPASFALIGLGLAGLGFSRRKVKA